MPKARRPKTWEETEADARAKLLMYLVENKLVTLCLFVQLSVGF
jgi:hypothetical protein